MDIIFIILPPIGQSCVPLNKIVWRKSDVKHSTVSGILVRNQEYKYLYYYDIDIDIDIYLTICSHEYCENTPSKRLDRKCTKHAGYREKCEKCDLRPSFNYPGQTKAKFCYDHKEPEMVDIKHKKCEKCGVRPSFNHRGEIAPRFCTIHKELGMIDITRPICQKCNKIAYYSFSNQRNAIFCHTHKELGMKNLASKTCEKCNKFPIFNHPNERPARFCIDHKNPDMIDVKNKQCQICNKRAYYNYPDQKHPHYCIDHKREDMKIIAQTCVKCSKTPSFNYRNERTARFCHDHKESEMINVKVKRCQNCHKIAYYNFPGEKLKLFCLEHRQTGMVRIGIKICIESNCQSDAVYGPFFEKAKHCYDHKSANEYKKRYPDCIISDCKERPYYTNDSTGYPLRCEIHHLVGDVNIIEKPCVSCGLTWFIPTDRDKCNDCYAEFEKKITKRKERHIYEFLTSNGEQLESYDRQIPGGCSLRRPDMIKDRGLYKIILEVDEHGHSSYDCSCEQIRMGQIYFDLGGIPVVFIRYNPDSYIDSEGIRHSGDRKRENYLLDFIRSFNNVEEVDDPLTIYYLFYNGWSGAAINDKYIVDPYSMQIRSAITSN